VGVAFSGSIVCVGGMQIMMTLGWMYYVGIVHIDFLRLNFVIDFCCLSMFSDLRFHFELVIFYCYCIRLHSRSFTTEIHVQSKP
jgi:hypothetical protein